MANPLPPRPRRRRRRFIIGLAVFALVLVGLVAFAPMIVAKTSLRQAVLTRIFDKLNGRATAGGASLGWFTPIELTDITVTDPAGRPALIAAKVTSSKTLLDLLQDQSDLGTFTIEQPVLEVVCEPDTTNIEQAITNWLTDDGTPPAAERLALAVQVTQGRIILKRAGQEGERVLDPFELTVNVPRPRSEPVTLTLSAATPGKLDLAFTFGPETEAKLTANQFAVEALQPLLHRFATGTRAAGSLTADLTARWGANAPADFVIRRAALVGFDLAGPWLGPDQLHLQKMELLTRPEQPCRVTLTGDELRLEQFDLSCDAGRFVAACVVRPDAVAASLLNRPGQTLNAEVDVAKLAALLPRALRLRDGIELREGRIAAHLQSQSGKDGTAWNGALRATALKGTHHGKPIIWDKPLMVEFAGRLRPDGLPTFDKLQCQSDFIGLAARGSVEEFVAAANVDLDRLAARLSQFVDLGGIRLEGTARLDLRSLPNPGGGFRTDGSIKLVRFAFQDAAGRGVREPELTATLHATGKRDPAGPLRLDTGEASLSAAGDTFTLSLIEPVADVRTVRTGKLAASVSGDFARWRNRLSPWVSLPPAWQIAGAGRVAGTVAFTPDGVRVDRATVDLTGVRFHGAGLALAEPTLKAESGLSWTRKTGALTLTDVHLSCETAGVSARRLDLRPTPSGYGLTGTTLVTANVNRVQRALGLQTDPTGDDALGGLAKGTIGFDNVAGSMAFTSEFTIDRFTLGPPARPTWTEPHVQLTVAGRYDPAGDAVRFKTLKAERDGLSAEAHGTLSKLSSTRDIQLAGTLAYDLSRLEPQLKAYLGKSARIVGKDRRAFELSGRPTDIHAAAAVAWKEIRAYGFDVGPAELRAVLDHGTVTMNPVEATFGGGKVRLQPTLTLTAKDADLSFAKGRVVEHAKLTPAACASALGFALPAIANTGQADGLLSFDLDDNRIPLSDPDRSRLRGKLTIHSATVSPGPLVAEIITLLGAKQTRFPLATEQVVPVRVENGRVYHENFALKLGESIVQTSGSVGFDGSLALVLDVPLPPRALEKLLANNPRLRDALAKQRLKLPVGGTLDRPQLDPRAFEAAVAEVMRAATRDAARSAIGDLLKKGEGKLLDDLRKKLEPKPPGK
jgi:hypothetical protein